MCRVADALLFLVTALPVFIVPTAQSKTPLLPIITTRRLAQSIEEELHRPRE